MSDMGERLGEFITEVNRGLSTRKMTPGALKWFKEEIRDHMTTKIYKADRFDDGISKGWDLQFLPGTDVRNVCYYMYHCASMMRQKMTCSFNGIYIEME